MNGETVAQKPSPPCLVIRREQAHQKLSERIRIGQAIRAISIDSVLTFQQARDRLDKWSDYNRELLTRLFDNDTMADEYKAAGLSAFVAPKTFGETIVRFQMGVSSKLNKLESIRDRLDLIPEISLNQSVDPGTGAFQEQPAPTSARTFVVHGHDDAAKESVSRFLENLGLDVIILHEQPNAGRTIIEKFERFSDVGFAVVLLTPDDAGGQVGTADVRPRARQNVIFELGYFVGRLGRERVCALHKGNVEILSDYEGVLYIPTDSSGAWKLQLARELKQAGLPADLNKTL